MSYVFPSVAINYITYIAKRWGQAPKIQYAVASPVISAGQEYVTVLPDLSKIIVTIASGTSTNAQILAALLKNEPAIDSLYARDLVSAVITAGHASDTNIAVAAQSMTGATVIAPPVETPKYQFIGLKADAASLPLLTPLVSGMYQVSYYMIATAGADSDTAPTLFVRWTDKTTSQQAYASAPATGNATLWGTGIYTVWCEAGNLISMATSGGTYTSAVYDIYAVVTKL